MALTNQQINELRQKYNINPSSAPTKVSKSEPVSFTGTARDFATGFTKGLLNSAIGTARTLQTAGQGIIAATDPTRNFKQVQEETGLKSLQGDKAAEIDNILKPQNTTEKVGSGAAFVAEALIPTGTRKLATEAVEGVGSLVKKGTQGAADVVGTGIEKTGQKIQQSVIRPSAKDISDGFKIENVAKHDLGGSLPETITKSHVKLNDLGKKLKLALNNAPDNTAIDLNSAVEMTEKRLLNNKSSSFGDTEAIKRVVENLKKEVQNVGDENSLVDLASATEVKRGAGTKGAWAYNRPEADATAIEKVYTEFYDVLKDEIERYAPESVKEINKELSEIIPIYNAAIRRLPIEQRNNALSLTDNIGLFASTFDPKSLLILGATKAAKSGRVGNALQKAGAALKKK